jgi:hypothetical protein
MRRHWLSKSLLSFFENGGGENFSRDSRARVAPKLTLTPSIMKYLVPARCPWTENCPCEVTFSGVKTTPGASPMSSGSSVTFTVALTPPARSWISRTFSARRLRMTTCDL